MREMSSLIYNASEEQVIRARNQLKASILFSQDGPGGGLPALKNLFCLLAFRRPAAKIPVSMQVGALLCEFACCMSAAWLDCHGCGIGVAEDIARQLLVYGRRVPKAELFARIDAVDEETVKEVASRFIYDQELAIAAMGDTQTLPDYNWFRRRTYWLRY
jgi:hypothetical protein